jgi:hypothetical protein
MNRLQRTCLSSKRCECAKFHTVKHTCGKMSTQANYEVKNVENWSIFVSWFATKYSNYWLKTNKQ